MYTRLPISTSGEGTLIHWSPPVLPIGSYRPRRWRVVLSSRLTELRLPLSLTAAERMKSGCAGATGVAPFSSPTSIPQRERRVGRPTDNRLLSLLVGAAM